MKTGFIGLGQQGKYLAINLADAGHELMVYDVRPGPLEELARAGATIADSPRAIGHHAEVIAICVLDDAQLEAVIFGPEGVLEAAAPGTVVVIHSTVEPSSIAKIAAAAAPLKIEVMDAPVSGGEPGAKGKTMSYMVGGSVEAFERCLPLFQTSGQSITRTGPLGTGIRAKLAHQLIVCINMLAAYEGMRLGREAGLPSAILEQVVHEGGAQSRIADQWSRLSLKSATSVFFKDLQICLKFAHELGLSVPGAALVQQLLDQIVPGR
jgi:3-hydroxyisobutyrate dehydrogenase-like beta-hydroxyacid dehydrogenase